MRKRNKVIMEKIWTKVLNQHIFNYHGLKAVIKGYFYQIICYNYGLKTVVDGISIRALALKLF